MRKLPISQTIAQLRNFSLFFRKSYACFMKYLKTIESEDKTQSFISLKGSLRKDCIEFVRMETSVSKCRSRL
jgi:hypothetical protein